MALTPEEQARLLAIENALNDIQIALNKTATRQDYKALTVVFQRQVNELKSLVDQMETTGSGSALDAHKTNPSAHGELNDRYYQQNEFIDETSGVADAGKPVLLDSTGRIHHTMVEVNLESHSDMLDLDSDDHTQYLTSARGDVRYYLQSEVDDLMDTHEHVHNQLSGLNLDDHTQYLLADGTRDVTGDLTVTGNLTTSAPSDQFHAATKSYVDGLIQGVEWHDPVISRTTVEPPGSPSSGDRYIVPDVASGVWVGQEKDIASYDGSWAYTTPTEGYASWVQDEDKQYVFNGTDWVKFGSTISHDSLIGLQDDDHAQYLRHDGTRAMSGNLAFGGFTSSEPMLKQSGNDLLVRRADDSNYTDLFALNLRTANTGYHGYVNRSRIYSDADGSLRLTDNLGTDFDLLQFGGATSSYPALKREGTTLRAKVADGSGDAFLQASSMTAGFDFIAGRYHRWTNGTRLASPVAGNIVLEQADDFGLLQFGGGTSFYPAWKREGVNLRARLADDSGDTGVIAGGLTSITNVTAGSSYGIGWSGRSIIGSTADGYVELWNNGGTSFTMLRFGGVTSAFPALKRSGDDLHVRLADDSNYAGFRALAVLGDDYLRTLAAGYIGWTNRSRMRSSLDGDIRFTNEAGTDFGLLQLGGITDAYPALKRVGNALSVNKADDSGGTALYALNFFATDYVRAGAGTGFYFTASSRMRAATDGNITLQNQASSDFGLLQFGGTDATYPALKRNGTGLQVRLADDSTYGSFVASSIVGATLVSTDGSGYFRFTGRSRLHSDADGNIRLTNNAENDFGLLQFGGTSNLFPALKRNGDDLDVVKADDSGLTAMRALQFNATFSVVSSGNIDAGASSAFRFTGSSKIAAPADGDLTLTNAAGDDFGLIRLGGATNDYPAIKRDGQNIVFRRGSDAANTSISYYSSTATQYVRAGSASYFGWPTRSRLYSPADGTIQLTDDAAADFTMLQFGGSTNAYPAFKRNANTLRLKLADDTDYADLYAYDVVAHSVGEFRFSTTRSVFTSPADGEIILSNAAKTGFTKLSLGPQDASHLALVPSGLTLIVQRGDGGTVGHISANDISAAGYLRAGAAEPIFWLNRARLYSPDTTTVEVKNSTNTDFANLSANALFTPKSMVTPEGGVAVSMLNKTGAASVKGTVVQPSTTTDDAVEINPVSGDEAIGVIYNSGVADGSAVWVVVSGIAEILLEDSTASTRSYWVQTSDTTAGRADATNASPPGLVVAHFQEIGHCIQSVIAGTDQLARVVLHFN